MFLSKIGEQKSKAIGLLVTIALVALLVLAGPANALTVSLSSPGTNPFTKGVTIDVPGSIQINSNEILGSLKTIDLNLVGPTGADGRVCSFALDGTPLSSCPGVTLEVTNNLQNGYGYGYFVGNGYGYGYGFSDGQITYIVHIDTNQFSSGSYTVQVSSAGEFSENQPFEIAALVCKEVLFRSKGYWDNHLSKLAPLLPLTVGGEVVTDTVRAHQIFERETKVDKVKAPLLSIRANLVLHPEAAAYFAPDESVTVGALAAEADALLQTSATTAQLTLMKDRLNKVTGVLSSCENGDGVQDTTPPVLTVPADITKEATSSSGAKVKFEVSATDNSDDKVDVSCVPKSGSTFPLGTTVVTCTATDDFGNTATASFNVLVTPMCKEITFRSKGYFENHPAQWTALLPQTLGSETVSTTVRVAQIFARTTKVDKVKAPLLALKFNLQNFPEAASMLVPGESVTMSALAAEADALLQTSATTAQLTLMKDRLESTTITFKSCPKNHDNDDDDEEEDNGNGGGGLP